MNVERISTTENGLFATEMTPQDFTNTSGSICARRAKISSRKFEFRLMAARPTLMVNARVLLSIKKN